MNYISFSFKNGKLIIGGDYMFAKNLKYLREKNAMEQIELAKKLGRKSASTISEWEKGKYTPKIGILNDISEIFAVSINDLMNKDLTNEIPQKLKIEKKDNVLNLYSKLNKENKEKAHTFICARLDEQRQEQQPNVISFNSNSSNDDSLISFDWCGYVSAGTGEFLDGNERKSIIQLPKSDIPQNADFAVTVNGDSMKPVFKNHEMIFVEKTTDLSSGSIGIIVVEGEAFVKKIYIHDDCITLVSLNPTYKDKVIKNAQSIKVIGRVIL